MLGTLGTFLAIGLVLAAFIISFLVTWKTYDYFNTTLMDVVSTTGFKYHLSKFLTSLVTSVLVGGLVFFFAVGIIVDKNNGATTTTNTSVENSTENSKVKINSDSPENNSKTNSSNSIESSGGINKAQVEVQVSKLKNDAQPNSSTQFTKEEIQQMEEKAGYSGDDPIVRERLGLPPKVSN